MSQNKETEDDRPTYIGDDCAFIPEEFPSVSSETIGQSGIHWDDISDIIGGNDEHFYDVISNIHLENENMNNIQTSTDDIKIEEDIMATGLERNSKSPSSYELVLSNYIPSRQLNSEISTCSIPTTQNWRGKFNFNITFNSMTADCKNKFWVYSKLLDKLFIDMDKYIKLDFHVSHQVAGVGFYVRALPVYAVEGHCHDPVKRCPNHCTMNSPTNKDFPHTFVEHLIRVKHDSCSYECDPVSGRLSVTVVLNGPEIGSDSCSRLYKFMCLGSDAGSINRKPLKVIFTLELGEQRIVVGRQTIEVRICSCPKRDSKQEESKHLSIQNNIVKLADGLDNTIIVTTPKQPMVKSATPLKLTMLPVDVQDFDKLNEFAEAAMFLRNPDRHLEIVQQRQKLMDEYNAREAATVSKKRKMT